MNDYQIKIDKNYVLPQTVYRQALYAVKDLDRMRKKLLILQDNAYFLEAQNYTHISTGGICDATGNKAAEIATVSARINAIEDAFQYVPLKYREALFDRLVNDVQYNREIHCINTWKKWQQILLFHVALNLKLL